MFIVQPHNGVHKTNITSHLHLTTASRQLTWCPPQPLPKTYWIGLYSLWDNTHILWYHKTQFYCSCFSCISPIRLIKRIDLVTTLRWQEEALAWYVRTFQIYLIGYAEYIYIYVCIYTVVVDSRKMLTYMQCDPWAFTQGNFTGNALITCINR